MHAVGAMEAHEVMHGRWNKSATARDPHVDIRVGHHRVAGSVHNPPVNARGMVALFLDHFKRTGLRQMTIASSRDWTFQNYLPPPNQVSGLLLKIDFNGQRRLRE